MDNTWLSVIFGVTTAYFGAQTLRIMPTFLRLFKALRAGAVKWPGPRIHDPDPRANIVRERLGAGYQNLFPTFIWNALSVVATFVFSVLAFLSSTSLLSGYKRIEWAGGLLILALIALAGGGLAVKQALRNMAQVNTMLSDRTNRAEPREVDGKSAEAEYAIEHPLIKHRALKSDSARALDLFFEAVRCHQEGNERRALSLYQEAMHRDPSLHKNARETLSNMAQGCSPKDAGPIYYWLGAHSEYLMDWKQAQVWYEKAINAFNQIGYQKRESRAHCNLGNVKMKMRDPSAMKEFEKAIALNPRNGTAHLNIGRIYYGISEPGDYRYERALDAFADAIVADPQTYGPMVISSLRSIGYTWKEDLEKITQRVESRQC